MDRTAETQAWKLLTNPFLSLYNAEWVKPVKALRKTVGFFQKAKRAGEGESLARVEFFWISLRSFRLKELSRHWRDPPLSGAHVTACCNRWYNEAKLSSYYGTGVFLFQELFQNWKDSRKDWPAVSLWGLCFSMDFGGSGKVKVKETGFLIYISGKKGAR